jgi:type I restriction enzyme M protein
MRRTLLESIADTFKDQDLLTSFQVRGAFANYVNTLKADFKSIAASGWGPGLIPDDDILESQFPEVLEEMEQAKARRDELLALFSAAGEENFEDTEDTGVLPADEVKSKKDTLKALNTEWKGHLKNLKALAGNIFSEIQTADLLPKGEKKGFYCTEGLTQKLALFSNGNRILELAKQVGYHSEYEDPLKQAITSGELARSRAGNITLALSRHNALEEDLKEMKAKIKATENKRDELVESAREKITTDEARTVILDRLRSVLTETYEAYLRTDLRACIKAIENLWDKYAVTAKAIEVKRDEASLKLREFLMELGYE